MANQKHAHCERCGSNIKKRSSRHCKICKKRLCGLCQRPNGVCYVCQPDDKEEPDGAYWALKREFGI
jgi:hypothetical protein